MPIPVTILACEGDICTIRHIAGALEKYIPVIIIKGSGKAADLILDFLEEYVNTCTCIVYYIFCRLGELK
jgi:hypothetical protein